MESKVAHEVLLFYGYLTIEDPKSTADWLRALAEKHRLLGRAIVAGEGINATFEGAKEHTDAFVAEFRKDPRFARIDIKTSEGTGSSFPKLSVKVRNEIVGTRFPKEVDPRVRTASHLKPEELKRWYESGKEFVVVDMRNSYEFASGHFKNSIDPGLNNSRDLPEAVAKLGDLKDKAVLTVCTGGVRCEKMSAYLMHEGFKEVYQLDGGNRVIVGTCRFCSSKTERYVNCANNECHLHFLVCTGCVPMGEAAYCKEECKK